MRTPAALKSAAAAWPENSRYHMSSPGTTQDVQLISAKAVLCRLLAALEGSVSELLNSVVVTKANCPSLWYQHRKVWNGAINRSPAIIIIARGEEDVCRTVALAHEMSIELTVKGGGHNVAGSSGDTLHMHQLVRLEVSCCKSLTTLQCVTVASCSTSAA